MHFLVDFLVHQGYSTENISLVLMLPILITLLSLARQMIGIRGLGLATTLITILILSVTGFVYGLTLIILTIIIVSLLRWLTYKWRLLYLPRIAAILILALILLMALLVIPLPFEQRISLLALGLTIAIAERIILIEIEKSRREALFNILETLILASIGYSLVIWQPLQKLVLVRPDAVIIAALIINLALGKWTGLRLNEYWRFKKVIKHIELPEKK